MSQTDEKNLKTIKPEHNITASMAGAFKEELLKYINEGIEVLAIDMGNIEMVDSSGLSVFIATHNSLKARGGRLELHNVSDNVMKLFKITRLDKHFTIESV